MGMLDGRVVIITGSAHGIGRATAIQCAKEGASGVVIADINVAGLEETAKEIEAAGSKALAIKCDVLCEDEIDNVVASTIKEFGRIDGLCNCAQAGIGRQNNTIEDVTYEYALECFQGGPWASLLFIRKVAPYMKEQGYGRIVNFGSSSARPGVSYQCGYCIAKGGIEALTRSAALYYGKDGIIVNIVFPQCINEDFAKSPIGPKVIAEVGEKAALGYIGEYEDVAPVVSFLLSEKCHYMTGNFIELDAGIDFMV